MTQPKRLDFARITRRTIAKAMVTMGGRAENELRGWMSWVVSSPFHCCALG